MSSHFTRIYQVTLLVLFLQLVASDYVCTDGSNTTGFCLMKKKNGIFMLKNPGNDAGKLTCVAGFTPLCCPKGTIAKRFDTEEAAKKACPGKVSESASATGTGTTDTGGGGSDTGKKPDTKPDETKPKA